MAAVTANNVLVGAPDQATTGAIASAPLGTALPTAVGTALNAAFVPGGYISEDGLTLTPDRSTVDIKDWSGATVRRILESFDGTLAWAHLETSEESLKTYFGDANVSVTAATISTGKKMTATLGAFDLPVKSWAFKLKDGLAKILIVVPNGQVTEQGEVSFTKSGAITWPVVLTTYPDATGKNVYIYTDDGVFSA